MVLWYCAVIYMLDGVFVPQEQESIPFQNITVTRLFGPNVTCKPYKLGVFKFDFILFTVRVRVSMHPLG